MSIKIRLVLALVAAVVVGYGYMAFDTWRGAEWEVSPQQIEAAKAEGKLGYESRPGTVTVLPIRSEIADLLIYQWMLAGLAAGGFVLLATRPKKVA